MIGELAVAFAAGLLSCLSACVLPLMPAFVGYLAGQTMPQEGGRRRQLRVLGNSLLFVAGFSTAFIALGAAAGLVGADLRAYRPALIRLAGIALVVIGLGLLLGMPFLLQERRFHLAHRLRRGPWTSYVVGLAFAVGWTPCVGPVLSAVLIAAADSATAGAGAALLAAYSAGMAVPFLAAGAFLGAVTGLLARIRFVYPVMNGLAAALLIAFGVLVFTNNLTRLNGLVPYFAIPLEARLERSLPAGRETARGPVAVGSPAPAFTVTDTQGIPLALASLKGRPVILNFWATWCTPCRRELPEMSAAYRSHAAEGLALVAVDYEESPAAVGSFWRELRLEPLPYLDPEGRAAGKYGVGLSSTGLPVTVFIARDGTVRSYVPFDLDAQQLAEHLKDIL